MTHAMTSTPTTTDPPAEGLMQPGLALSLAVGMDYFVHLLQSISKRENSKFQLFAFSEYTAMMRLPGVQTKEH